MITFSPATALRSYTQVDVTEHEPNEDLKMYQLTDLPPSHLEQQLMWSRVLFMLRRAKSQGDTKSAVPRCNVDQEIVNELTFISPAVSNLNISILLTSTFAFHLSSPMAS